MTEPLLPCPFCGEHPKLYSVPDLVNQEYRVRCINKKCGIYQKGMGNKAWQTRPARTELLERLGAIYAMPEHSHKEVDSSLMISIADMLVKGFGAVTDRMVSEEEIVKIITTTNIKQSAQTILKDGHSVFINISDIEKIAEAIWNAVYGVEEKQCNINP